MHRSWLIVPALQLMAVAPCSGSDAFGVPIAEILFDPALPPDVQISVDSALSLRTGQQLDPAGLRGSIHALFRTGRFADVRADAVRVSGGVRLTFQTEPAWFIGNVRVEGVPRPPSEGRLINATKLRLGELFTDEKLADALRSLRAELADHGFRETALEPIVERNPRTQQAHVTLHVSSGPRARIGALLVGGGSAPLTAQEVRTIAGWPRGAEYRPDRLQRGINRLRQHFQQQDFWQPDIRVEPAEYNPAESELTLVVAIDSGPRMRVRVEGTGMPFGKLRRYLPVLVRGAVDEDLLESGKVNLRNLFQARGYIDASVEYEVERATETDISIVYRVDRGSKRGAGDVDIRGNRYFDTAAIRDRMQLKAAVLRSGRGHFTDALLAEDLQAIRSLYSSNGFRAAEVSGRLVNGSDGNSGRLTVRIDIEEGVQTLVGGLVTSGLERFPVDEFGFDFSSAPGEPFSEASIAMDQQRVLNEFYEAGYQDVTFNWRAEPGEAANEVVLFYAVNPGDRVLIGRTILSGSHRTREDVVDRRIELVPGSSLSQARISASQRNLYDLGVFSKVDVAVQNPEGTEHAKTVLFQVEEARRWAVGGGGGAEFARIGRNTAELTNPAGDATFSPRMTLEVTRLNVRGKAHTMSLRTRLSLLQQRGLFTYEAPRWFASDRWRLTLSGLYDTFRNVNTFTGRRFEGAAQLTQQLNSWTTVLYRYAYRRTSIDENTLNIEPLLVPLISQPVRVGLLSSTYISDRRDDPTDTSTGMYNTVNVALASKYWGGQPNFARVLAQNSTYHRIGSRIVFARTVQVGINKPWAGHGVIGGGNPEGEIRPDPRIPLSERYFGGGANSHRGFAYNQAGPRDPATGFPLGGGAQFLNSLELRFPLAGADFSGVLFHDAGNVYSRPGRISFSPSQPARTTSGGAREFEFDYMVHAIGLGIRYRTPVGPIRFDLAYSPNPPRFVGFDGTREQLLTGTGTFREQRIGALQFHFSLGQTF